MVVDKELIAGTRLGQTLGHLDGRLVVAVHEVDLPALDAHLGVFLTGLYQVLVEHIEDRPEHNAHVLGLRIVNQSLQVDVFDGIHDVAFAGVIPSLVEHYVGDMVRVLMPASKSTPFKFQSFHQSQATLPGLIHEVSPVWLGVASA